PDPTQGPVILPPEKQFTPSFGPNYGNGGYAGDLTTGKDDGEADKMLSILYNPQKAGPNTPYSFMPSQVDDNLKGRYSNWTFGVDNEELAHQMQTGWERFGNWGMNLIGKTVAYTAQNLGFMVGAPMAALTGDISNLTDNFLTKLGEGMKEGIENDFPIYK